MKKYLFRSFLAVFTAVLATGIYFGCTDDEANQFFDLTGRWAGWGASVDGGGRIELDIVQDTTGFVTGTVFTLDEKMDTLPFTGSVTDGHFSGTGYGECSPHIELDVKKDGMLLVGTAVDKDSATCNTDPVDLLFYKVVEATVDISGSWNGTHVGTDTTGNFLMVVNQIGGNVTGNIYDVGDTTALHGRVLGNVFEGILEDQVCPVIFYMEVDGNSMNGRFISIGSDVECTDRGTVTANRITGKIKK